MYVCMFGSRRSKNPCSILLVLLCECADTCMYLWTVADEVLHIMLTNKVACGDGEHAAVQGHHSSSRGAGIVLSDELLPCMYVQYVCMYVCVKILIPRTCFILGITTHLDVVGTTPPEMVCMYVRLNTRKGDVPWRWRCGCYSCLWKYVSGMCEGMVDW